MLNVLIAAINSPFFKNLSRLEILYFLDLKLSKHSIQLLFTVNENGFTQQNCFYIKRVECRKSFLIDLHQKNLNLS